MKKINKYFILTLPLLLCYHFVQAEENQAIDLKKLFGSTSTEEIFTPYIYDRNELWILLPLISLLMLLFHLLQIKPTRPAKVFDHKQRAIEHTQAVSVQHQGDSKL